MVDPRSLFTEEEIERARAYHHPLYLALLARLAIVLGILSAASFSRAGDALFAGLVWWAQTLVFAAVLIAITTLATLPLSFWAGFLHEHAWRFSTQSVHGFLTDRTKALLVELLLSGAALLALVALARSLPHLWPLAASAAAAVLALLLSLLAPLQRVG